jgi:hypothetical protein
MEDSEIQKRLVKEKFPSQSGRIDELYNSNEDFRILCAHYFTSFNLLDQLRNGISQKKESIEEYENLLTLLEDDLYDFVLKGK